jgi:hypothetical protein
MGGLLFGILSILVLTVSDLPAFFICRKWQGFIACIAGFFTGYLVGVLIGICLFFAFSAYERQFAYVFMIPLVGSAMGVWRGRRQLGAKPEHRRKQASINPKDTHPNPEYRYRLGSIYLRRHPLVTFLWWLIVAILIVGVFELFQE